MASTYVNNLRLEEIGTGEQSGTWGDTTNTNLEIIGQAVAWGTRAIANASTDNITITDGALDADRCLGLKLTGGGQACTVTLLPNTSSKTWFMYNATAAALTFTCGSGANVIIPAGQTKVIATDGLGSGGVVHDLLTAVNLAGITQTAAVTTQGTLTVGVDDTGYDVKFFGATSGKSLLWDESADSLIVTGTTTLVGTTNLDVIDVDGAANFAADVTFANGADIITASAGTSNFRAGVNAGNSIASGGNFNVAVGDEAGTAITTGDRNTVVGYQAGDAITTGSENTALGRNAGGALTTGGTNTFVGADAGTSITTGASNTIIGRNNGNAEIDLRTASNRIVISDGGGNIGLYMDNNSQAFFGDMDLDTDGAAMNAQAVGTAMAGNFYQDDTGDSVLVKMRHGRANSSNSALATMISFCRGDGGERGSIKVNGTGATSFNTSSDYRLKENVDYNWDATTRLKQLKPARFNFIADADTTVDGFLAHEAATVVPDAVIGVKDATHVVTNVVLSASDEVVSQGITEESWTKRKADILYKENDIIPDGKSVGDVRKAAKFPSDSKWVATHTLPLNQQIDHSKIVPLLVKTIQELEARITTLEG